MVLNGQSAVTKFTPQHCCTNFGDTVGRNVDEQSDGVATMYSVARLVTCRVLGASAAYSERISRWRRASSPRPDEPDPMKASRGVFSWKRTGKVGDELIYGDTPAEGLGLKPRERFRWKIERHCHRSHCTC